MKNYDFVIRNGKVFDGVSLSDGIDIALNGEKIVEKGAVRGRGRREIDASGLIVSPGFIDVHTHITSDQMRNNDGANLIFQGVTSAVTGNCGKMENPQSKKDVIDTIRRMKESDPPINVATLVGHNAIRRFSLEDNPNRQATPSEIYYMIDVVKDAIYEGAIGFSTGLMYDPGRFADEEEIFGILEEVRERGKIYTTHIRDEGERLEYSVNEVIKAAKETGIKAQISHHKATGKDNWGKVRKTIPEVREARKEGDITLDTYVYTATSAGMHALLPKEVSEKIEGHLDDIDLTEEIISLQRYKGLQNMCENSWGDVLILEHSNPEYVDRTVMDINSDNPTEEYLRIIKEDPDCMGLFRNIASYDDISYVLNQPFTMVVSDGYLYDSSETPKVHPRNFGATSKFLKEFVRDGDMDMETGLRKITSQPADRFSLEGRGYLKKGYYGDIAVFDINKINNRESFEEPYLLSEGMEYVFCNGTPIFEEGEITGSNGKFMT